jgi:cag pathogenicity island protein 24
MPKYRRLSLDEFKELEKEFVHFLSLNGIDAPSWEKLKAEQAPQVEELLDGFSDGVMEGVLRKVQYLIYAQAQDIKVFQCEAEKIVMRGLRIEGSEKIDLTSGKLDAAAVSQLLAENAKLQTYSAEKSYKDGDRNMEIFRMLNAGAKISRDAELFELFASLSE